MEPKWPLKPDHITSDGYKHIGEKIHNLDGLGVIPNRYLRAILTEIASILKNPNTVLEFPPDIFKEPVRTDSISIHFDLHPPCRKFRECTNAFYCHKNDNLHANIFRELSTINLYSDLIKRIKSPSFRDEFKMMYKIEPRINVKKFQERCYIEYDCPILGYRELVFPIIFEKMVMGVFFLGQLCLEGQEELTNKRREHFFSIYKNCFDDYNVKRNENVTPSVIAELDKSWKNNTKNVYTYEKYENLIKDTIYEIKKIERRLKYEMEIQRKEYILSKFESYITNYRNKLNDDLAIGEQGLENFWEKIEDILIQLNNDFPVDHFSIFGLTNFTKDPPEKLKLVASAGLNKKLYRNLKYDLNCIPKNALNTIITSRENSDLFQGLSGVELDKRKDLIRIFPSPSSPHNIFVIWVRYDNTIWPRLLYQDNESDRTFNNAIQSFYSILASTYSSIWAATATDLMEKAWRVLTHETGQVTSGIDAIRQQYFSNPKKLRKLTDEKIDDLNHDVEGLLRQLYFLSDRGRQLISELQTLNRESFLAFHELLYKWRSTYRLQTEKKNINIIVADTYRKDPDRPEVYGDKLLLEQLVYNLVDNAVKYCYEGTNIRLDCKKLSRNPHSPHVLTVTNYGIEIKDEENIYGLYKRGQNVRDSEGLGIGLYVAKRIAEVHGGIIEHTCTKISDFNIPLINAYIQTTFPPHWKKNEKLIDQLKEEFTRLKNLRLYNEVVALYDNEKNKYIPTKAATLLYINKPTFKVIFHVTIPIKEK